MNISASIRQLMDEIAAACAGAGREVSEITLVAVSKTVPASFVREAHAAGIRHFGENRVQEILAKSPALRDLDFVWHMIGHLQTNKARALLPHLGVLHSLDRAELVDHLSGLVTSGSRVPVLIQVNTTGEGSKSGVAPVELRELADRVLARPSLELRGLMTIGPLGGTEAENRRAFALLRGLRDRLRAENRDLALPFLSMGMSDDFPIAIQEGATHLRIGSRIFGARA
jgi:hypothetical protein